MNPVNYSLWTNQVQTSCDSLIQRLANSTTALLNTLPGYDAVKNAGGADQVTPSKVQIEANLTEITADTAKRLTYANTLAVLPANRGTNASDIQSQETTLTGLRTEVDQKKTLYTLRQGQATSLADKYASAAYSSWWPLWFPVGDAKPLSESTRTVLYLFTGASVLYLASGGARSPGSRTQESENNQQGGSRARAPSKIRK